MPIGIELPLAAEARVYGTAEMFNECRQLDFCLADPALPRAWYYLEAELFGVVILPCWAKKKPLIPDAPLDRLHSGAPLVAASNDGKIWWGIASEADYGPPLCLAATVCAISLRFTCNRGKRRMVIRALAAANR